MVEAVHDYVVSAGMAPGHVRRMWRKQERHVLGAAARIVAIKQGDGMSRLVIRKPRADPFQFVRGAREFGIGAARLQIVREHALPISFLAVVQGMPVPVFDHVGAGRRHQVDILPQLAVIGRKLRPRIPADCLGVDFRDQVIRALERPRIIAAGTGTHAVIKILRRVIRVHAYDVDILRDRVFVDILPRGPAEILHDELIGAQVFVARWRLARRGYRVAIESW